MKLCDPKFEEHRPAPASSDLVQLRARLEPKPDRCQREAFERIVERSGLRDPNLGWTVKLVDESVVFTCREDHLDGMLARLKDAISSIDEVAENIRADEAKTQEAQHQRAQADTKRHEELKERIEKRAREILGE